MEVYILGSNYHDINYGFETKLMQILFAEFHMHQYSGQSRRRVHGHFRSSCPIVFPPATPSYTKFFPPITVHKQQFQLHYSYRISAFRGYQPRILPGASDVTLIRIRWPPPQLSCFSSLLAVFLFPVLVIAAPFFACFLSAANTLWNAVSAFVVVTSACQITRVNLLSLFSVTLSPVGSTTERYSKRTVLRSGHFLCVKERPSRYAS